MLLSTMTVLMTVGIVEMMYLLDVLFIVPLTSFITVTMNYVF